MINFENKKWIIISFFILTFIMYVFFEYIKFQDLNSWAYGDWLINYQAGFVRRGLVGELATSDFLNINPGVFVFGLKVFCFFVFLFFSAKLILSNNVNDYVFILLSPAIFTFPINDPGTVGRKEILLFAILAFCIYRFKENKKSLNSFYLILSPLVVLAHEVLVLGLPFVLYLEYGRSNLSISLAKKIVFKSLPSVVAFLFCIFFRDLTLNEVISVHQKVVNLGYDLKEGGAIWSLYDGEKYIRLLYENGNLSYRFIPYFILSMIPFFMMKDKFMTSSNVGFSLLIVPFLGLFIVSFFGIDIGRWIAIYLTCLFFVTFSFQNENHKEGYSKLELWFVCFYSLSWALPHSLFSNGIPIWLRAIGIYTN